MREILFRGIPMGYRAAEDPTFVYGWLECNAGMDRARIHCIEGNSGYSVEVGPATVGQYTGLKDMYGREIWEGDVAQYYGGGWDEEDGPGVIKWDEDAARFILENDGLTVDFDNCWSFELEIIGNIYDNPELLKGGEA